MNKAPKSQDNLKFIKEQEFDADSLIIDFKSKSSSIILKKIKNEKFIKIYYDFMERYIAAKSSFGSGIRFYYLLWYKDKTINDLSRRDYNTNNPSGYIDYLNYLLNQNTTHLTKKLGIIMMNVFR